MKKIKNKDQIVCVGALITGNLIFGLVPTLQKITFPYGGSGLLTGFYSSLLALFSQGVPDTGAGDIQEAPYIGRGQRLYDPALMVLLQLYTGGGGHHSAFCIPHADSGGHDALFRGAFFPGKWNRPFSRNLRRGFDWGGGHVPGQRYRCCSGAWYIIYLQRSGLSDLNTSLVNFYIALMNMIMSLAACLFAGQLKTYTIWWAWLIIVLVSILHRVIGYGLFQLGMRKVQPVSAGILCTFEPASALVFGIIILHESVTAKQVGGLVCILSAVLVNLGANYRNAGKRRKKRARK